MLSNLGIDQVHYQHNAVAKEDGVAIGLTECPAAQHRWIFSGPQMERVINETQTGHQIGHCSINIICHIYCWSQPIEPLIEPKRTAGRGWVGTDGGKWDVVWSYLPEASELYRELLRRG